MMNLDNLISVGGLQKYSMTLGCYTRELNWIQFGEFAAVYPEVDADAYIFNEDVLGVQIDIIDWTDEMVAVLSNI